MRSISFAHLQQTHLPQLVEGPTRLFEQLVLAVLDYKGRKYEVPIIRCECQTFLR